MIAAILIATNAAVLKLLLPRAAGFLLAGGRLGFGLEDECPLAILLAVQEPLSVLG